MHAHPLLTSNIAAASAGTTAAALIQQVRPGTIEVDASLYTALAMLLGLAGVYLARLVTIDAENRRLGRRQSGRETWPLTLIGVLIVCPVIWHFEIAIPWASMIGLGVGYTVRVVLKIIGAGTIEAARAMARRAVGELDEERPPLPPPTPVPSAMLPPPHMPDAVILPPDGDSVGQDHLKLLGKLDGTPGVGET